MIGQFRPGKSGWFPTLPSKTSLILVNLTVPFVWQRAALVRYLQVGLLNRPAPPADPPEDDDPEVATSAGAPG